MFQYRVENSWEWFWPGFRALDLCFRWADSLAGGALFSNTREGKSALVSGFRASAICLRFSAVNSTDILQNCSCKRTNPLLTSGCLRFVDTGRRKSDLLVTGRLDTNAVQKSLEDRVLQGGLTFLHERNQWSGNQLIILYNCTQVGWAIDTATTYYCNV